MTNQQTCPHCGADGYFNVRDADWRYECHSSCNADGAEFYISEDCYKRQLAAHAAEIERLRGVLDKIDAMLPQHDSDGSLFQIYLDSDGYAQFEPVNAGVLVTEIAALITEEKGEVK